MKQQLLHILWESHELESFANSCSTFKNNNISMLLDSWYDTEERAYLFKHTYTYQK